jgi:3-hydroxyacyl-CoA dehydrogenase
LPQLDSEIAILSVKSKNHTLGRDVIIGVQEAVHRAEADFKGLVVWHEAPFAVGANLAQVTQAIAAGQFDRLEQTVEKFQRASQTRCSPA